jgi:hypothetical protein
MTTTPGSVFKTVFWANILLKNRAFPSFLHSWESKWVEVRVLGGGREGVYLSILPGMGLPPTMEFSLSSARIVHSMSTSNTSFHKLHLTLHSGKKLGLKTQDGGDLLVLLKALRESGVDITLEVESLEGEKGGGGEAPGSSGKGGSVTPTESAVKQTQQGQRKAAAAKNSAMLAHCNHR